MKMTKEYKAYRKSSGMVDLEKILTKLKGRRVKAYKISGTQQHGSWWMLNKNFKGLKYEN